jgi:hypothetical protein
MLVHAKDEAARNWYLQWEFEPSATDPLHLYLLMKDLKSMVSLSPGQVSPMGAWTFGIERL